MPNKFSAAATGQTVRMATDHESFWMQQNGHRYALSIDDAALSIKLDLTATDRKSVV